MWPYRERLRGQLMLALYRAGRQSEALAAYQAARSELLDGLGIEPGTDLKRLERRILEQDPALDATPARPAHTRLPTPPTALVGRDAEVEAVVALLARPDVRLVTLTGGGGIGKTRLALEVARAAAPRFPDGAFYVPLASLADPALVLPAIARAIGLTEGGGVPLEEALAARLAEGDRLVLLDNLEHLLEGVGALGALVAAAPGLTLLATSRRPLRLYGEHRFAVPPLAPEAAEQLFVDRARAAGALVETGNPVGLLCQRLDGLPLAIELAAARASQDDLAELLSRMDERLELLTEGAVDQPERHQTLRATLAWSEERLPSGARALFARLAVFAGGWTIDAADAICGDGEDVVAGLAALVDASLVEVERDATARQIMLETVRVYAGERLELSGEPSTLRRRHADWFLALAEEAEPHLRGRPGSWLDRLERDHANLRAALDALEGEGDAVAALRLAGALWRFWYLHGHLAEGRRRLERALGADASTSPARARALLGATVMAVNLGDPAASRAWAEEALALHTTLNDAWGAAYARFMLSHVVGEDERQPLLAASIRVFEELGDEHTALLARRHLAFAHADAGDAAAARALNEETLIRAREAGNPRMQASMLGILADDAVREGRADDARAMLLEAVELHREAGDELDMAVDVTRLAAVLAPGDAGTAALLLGCVAALSGGFGSRGHAIDQLHAETVAVLRRTIGEDALGRALEDGGRLSLDAAALLVRKRYGSAE